MAQGISSLSRLVLGLVLGCASVACSAVYPEVSSPVRPAPQGRELSPPPPPDLYFLRFSGATIPATTRDGRKWDSVGGSAPDPFAKILVDGKELFRTPVQSNTLAPTWPDAKRANYRIAKDSLVRVELWDSNPINNHPICVKDFHEFSTDAKSGQIDIECDSGAKITLVTEPAHAKIGLGIYYEFRTESIYLTRVLAESPARRVGLDVGDEVVRIQGKDVKTMDEAEARSLVNANAVPGVTLTVKKSNGSMQDVTLKEGPLYPTVDEDVPVE